MLFSELPTLAERVAAVPPSIHMERTVGVEIECNGNRARLAKMLRDVGLASKVRDGACGYHCNVDACFDGFIVHPTSDGSVSGPEVVIGGRNGTLVASSTLHASVEQTCAVLLSGGAATADNCGGHIHVSKADLTGGGAGLLVRNAMALKPELHRLMGNNSRNGVRNTGYARQDPVAPNTPRAQQRTTCGNPGCTLAGCHNPHYDPANVQGVGDGPAGIAGGKSCWMWFSSNTIEWRGWNGTLLAWRILLGLYTSAAMTQAAVDGREARVGEPLMHHLEDYLPGYVKLLMLRQLRYVVQAEAPGWDADEAEVPVVLAPAGV